jgi:hypothetical protein
MAAYYETTSPLRDALTQILGVEPPFPSLEGAYTERDMGEYPDVLTDGIPMDLAFWCGWAICERPHQPGAFTTGDAIVEAAELLVKRAVQNANIPPKGDR